VRVWTERLLVLSLWLCLLCNIEGNCEFVGCKVTGIEFMAVFIVQYSGKL
jgi:hypothetical protein